MDPHTPPPGPPARATAGPPLALVVDLCGALHDATVRYCHWKSNEAIDRSASGDNDLDLLVERADADRFGQVLHRLGFKQARPESAREVPGLIDHYALDAASGRLVHLQAHYQLVLGDDMTKSFRLPVERAYLASSRVDGVFALPAPDFELALFVVRMVLKHASWDAQASLLGSLSDSEGRELAHLFARVPPAERVAAIVARLPFLTPALVGDCLRALGPEVPRRHKAAIARALETELAPFARRARPVDVALRTGRRGARLAQHAVGHKARKQLVSGGSLIGVIGVDPLATSTLVDGLVAWLGTAFRARRFDIEPGRATSPATDGSARRWATNGDIAVCHRVAGGTGASPGWPEGQWPDVVLQVVASPDEALVAPIAHLLDGTSPPATILGEARERVWQSL